MSQPVERVNKTVSDILGEIPLPDPSPEDVALLEQTIPIKHISINTIFNNDIKIYQQTPNKVLATYQIALEHERNANTDGIVTYLTTDESINLFEAGFDDSCAYELILLSIIREHAMMEERLYNYPHPIYFAALDALKFQTQTQIRGPFRTRLEKYADATFEHIGINRSRLEKTLLLESYLPEPDQIPTKVLNYLTYRDNKHEDDSGSLTPEMKKFFLMEEMVLRVDGPYLLGEDYDEQSGFPLNIELPTALLNDPDFFLSVAALATARFVYRHPKRFINQGPEQGKSVAELYLRFAKFRFNFSNEATKNSTWGRWIETNINKMANQLTIKFEDNFIQDLPMVYDSTYDKTT